MRQLFSLIYWSVLVPAVGIVLWVGAGWAFAGRTPRMNGIVFLAWGALILLASVEWLVRTRLLGRPAERATQISFISDRRKITLELASIVYIESRDSFVLVHTSDGQSFTTRMKISQWETALDDRFVRIHRSFIVSRAHITRIEAGRVWLAAGSSAAETPIEISRKYKDKI